MILRNHYVPFPYSTEDMMSEVINLLKEQLEIHHLHFQEKPILIGGMAMEYYDMRKSGDDIDLVICNNDYLNLAHAYPENRKDIFGDLGVVIWPFEIWRSIAHLDYDFYKTNAIEHDIALVVSMDRLLLMRVCAMDVQKYKDDLLLIREYYYSHFTNKKFHTEAETHTASYEKNHGVVLGGKYIE
jgi:hypothetical protein